MPGSDSTSAHRPLPELSGAAETVMKLVESYEVRKRINGESRFYLKVIVEKDGEYFLGKYSNRKQEPTEFQHLEDVKPIPTKNRGPTLRRHWTIAPEGNGFYVKRPHLEDYLDSNLEARIEHEIEMCELVKKHSHGNLAVYHGALVDHGRVSGLVFERYETTLLEKVNPQGLSKTDFARSPRPLVECNMRAWLHALRGALDHLHELGIVHNDVTPANIMLDAKQSPVIIDFGSLCREGESLQHAKRTYEWYDGSVVYASKENDINALEELYVWMVGSVDDFRFTA